MGIRKTLGAAIVVVVLLRGYAFAQEPLKFADVFVSTGQASAVQYELSGSLAVADESVKPVGHCTDCDVTCCEECSCCCSICCLENGGLFGRGVLRYDECADAPVIPELLLGRFRNTEDGFDNFVSPISNPLFFEDPRITTETRAIFLNNKVPLAAAGGDIQVYALQLRARLTERLGLIASRDGFIVSQNALVGDGFADVDVGLKYALLRDVENQRLASIGFTYELPVGTPDALQGLGDGDFHLFLTGGTEFLDCGHWVSSFGGIVPIDAAANSSFIYWANHWDYQVRRGWYVVGEVNWFHYTDGGADTLGVTGVEGFDLANLGSGGVDGNDIVSGAFGMTYKPNRKTEISLAWELPLSGRRDLLENRINLDWILRY